MKVLTALSGLHLLGGWEQFTVKMYREEQRNVH